MIGSDDVLACFIAGNTFTWDDWFRLETEDDSFQPTIDMLLNVTIFIWFGAVCPWAEFRNNSVIPIYRLIPLGILVLMFRRLPIVYAMHKYIPQIEQKRQALFVGFFGPIGVSAIFYLYISLEFLNKVTVDGEIREDAQYLKEVLNVVIWFLVICSIVSLLHIALAFYLTTTTGRPRPQYPHGQTRLLHSPHFLQRPLHRPRRRRTRGLSRLRPRR
jgi:NhaP-type Na+/H+ or K+/H+ antiporter